MKLNSRLIRSRHGVYYLRLIVPKHLRSKFGQREIRRSLFTSCPIQAKQLAHYVSLRMFADPFKFRSIMADITTSFVIPPELERLLIKIDKVKGWTVRTPSGFEVTADPSNPEDTKSATDLVLKLAGLLENADGQQNTKTIVAQSPISAGPTGIKLSESMVSMKNRIRIDNQNKKTVDEYISKVNVFINHVGDILLSELTPKLISGFIHDLTEGKVINNAASTSTSNKYLTAINYFLNNAMRDGDWPDGRPLPTLNQRIKRKSSRRETSYEAFSTEDLKKIFKNANIFNWKQFTGHDLQPHMLFLPYLGIFTGARIEELCQLHLEDIYKLDPSDSLSPWIISINDKNSKKLKTDAARRQIPVHPSLIRAGLIVYREEIKNHFPNESLLFPYLTGNKYEKLSDAPSKWFGRYLDLLEIKGKKVFHSFRKTFNDELKQVGINEEVRCQILGHEYQSINSQHYSNIHKPEWIFENVIKMINYSGLDISHTIYIKGDFIETVSKLIKSRDARLSNKLVRN